MKITRLSLAVGISLVSSFIFSCSSDSESKGGKKELATKLCKEKYGDDYEGVELTNPTTGKKSDCQEYYTDACTEEGIEKLIEYEKGCGTPTTTQEYLDWVSCMSGKTAKYNAIIKSECPTLATN